MLFTISTTYKPATDLGFLLHKHPDKLQSFDISAGVAHIFYPEATEEFCTAAMLLDIDPVGLIRKSGSHSNEGFSLENYVNDRPYAASSFLSAAIAQVYSSALSGNCKTRPELVDQKMPLTVKIDVVSSKGGQQLIERLFSPLAYEIELISYPLDQKFPDWGQSRYYSLTLKKETTVNEMLTHLYVLIPVLDNDKHYFIGEHEMEKLLAKGKGWLNEHPEKELITRRFLKNLASLTRRAMERLMEEEGEPQLEKQEEVSAEEITKNRLHDQRLAIVRDELKNTGAVRVADLGCGEGKLIGLLLKEKQFEKILGMDVSYRMLEIAADRLHLDEMSPKQKERLQLIQGSLTYKDKRLEGYDAAALVEVIEHLDEARLASLQRVVFEFANPQYVIITTPNAEYNVHFERMTEGDFRHSDHRFEWTREQFEAWSAAIAEKYHYSVTFKGIGEAKEATGAPSQMALFTKA